MSDDHTKIPGAYPPTPPCDSGPTFSTLPHPAKTNNPADLNQPGRRQDEGLVDPLSAIFSAPPGPVIPDEETVRNLEKPLSREELKARAAALNKKD
ncbi:hypothetical protein F5887DRAFT_34726 [Amanita rubescens]|nr:hypothetical protein F5887DRAFT_34726 [Amanita rubescens]